MKEPSLRHSRLALAGGLAAVLVVGGGGFLLGRATTQRDPVVTAPAPVAAPSPEATPEPEASRGVLGRSDLIGLAALAADTAATGREGELGDAAGRRFELRLPFGCGGPAGEQSNAAMRWRYDAADNALRLHIAPVVWSGAEWWTDAPPPNNSTIAGWWIARPWTSSEACPTGNDQLAVLGAEPVTLSGQTVALGQISQPGDARDDQRNKRSYDAVVRFPQGELDTSKGFRLRISGRIARLPGSGPVRCQQPAGPEQRPICLVGVVLDNVAIENPANDETLVTWNVDQREAT